MTSERPPNLVPESVFSDYYIPFYETFYRSEAEADTIRRLGNLKPGNRVLDLACGHGRIARNLAKSGCVVTGIDSNPKFIQLAQTDALSDGLEIDYSVGDMRKLDFDREFDCVVMWMTSFGYFDDPTNRAVLAAILRSLVVGGVLILEHANLMRSLRKLSAERAEDVNVSVTSAGCMVDRRTYDPVAARVVTKRTVVTTEGVENYQFSIRHFLPHEIRDWLASAGFIRCEVLGEDGLAITLDSRRQLVVATRGPLID